MADRGVLPTHSTRDISWGANCDVCENRMNAGQAEVAAMRSGDGLLLCGSCSDEEKTRVRISELEAEVERLRRESEQASERYVTDTERLLAEAERLRAAIKRFMERQMTDTHLDAAVAELERAAGFSQQEGF